MSVGSLEQVKELRERTGAGMMDCKSALKDCNGDIEKAVDFLRKKGLAQAAKRAGREAKEGIIATRVDGKKAAIVEINCETDFVAKTDDFKKLVDETVSQILSEGESAVTSEKLTQKAVDATAKTGEKIVIKRAKVLESEAGLFFYYIHSNHKLAALLEIEGPESGSGEDPTLQELGKQLSMQIAASNPICIQRDQVPSEVIEREKAIFREEVKGKPENIVEKIIQGKLDKFYKASCLLEQAFIRDDKVSVQEIIDQASKKISKPIKIKRFSRFQLGESVA